MNGPRLTGSELSDLLFRRDGGGVLLSLCREEEAEYVTESGDFLRFAPCDPETRGRVRAQAEEEGISLWETKDYGDVNNLLRNMEAQTADRLALFGSDVDITYSVNGSRLSVGDAERLQEKAEELGVNAELILK